MSKALFGTHATPSSAALLDEVRRLRGRVAELEAALAAAEAAAHATEAGQPEAAATGATPAAPTDEVPAPAGR